METLDYEYIAFLVKQTKRGSSEAFTELFLATWRKEYALIASVVPSDEIANRLIEETYALVLKNIGGIMRPRLFAAWLDQIVFRIALNALRRFRREVPESDERIRAMEKILRLPPREAQPVIMKDYHHMSVREIARAMDSTVFVTHSRMRAARKKLKHMGNQLLLERRDI